MASVRALDDRDTRAARATTSDSPQHGLRVSREGIWYQTWVSANRRDEAAEHRALTSHACGLELHVVLRSSDKPTRSGVHRARI